MTEATPSRLQIEVGGQAVSYWRSAPAEPAAPRLLLLHGLGASSHIWEALGRFLGSTVDLIALDLPGAGGTPSQGVQVPSAQAGFAVRFLDALGISRVDAALGHSLGGTVALEMALGHRARVGGLMVLNAAPSLPLVPRLVLRNPVARRLSRLPSANMSSPLLVRAYLSIIFGEASRVTPEVVDGYARLAKAPDYSVRMNEQMEGLARHRRRRGDLRGIRVPTSVVWGDRDPLFGRRHGERLAAAIPQATLHRLPRVGHCPAQEVPEVVAELVRELLTRVGGRAG